MKNKTSLILLVFFMLLGIAFLGYYYKVSHEIKPQLPVIGNPGHHIDTFSFINQEGKVITNKDVKGKIYVAEYFFATCKSMCPKMNHNMKSVYDAFKGQKDIMILSHTVDPKRDSAAALKAYSQQFDADPNQWLFLTGDKQKLYDMARYSYLITAEADTTGLSVDKDFIHDNHFMLIDRNGYIRGEYDGLDVESVKKLISDIKILMDEKE